MPHGNDKEADASLSRRVGNIVERLARMSFLCRADYALVVTSTSGKSRLWNSPNYAYLKDQYLSQSILDEIAIMGRRQSATNRAENAVITLKRRTGNDFPDNVVCLLNCLGNDAIRIVLVNLVRMLKAIHGKFKYSDEDSQPGSLKSLYVYLHS